MDVVPVPLLATPPAPRLPRLLLVEDEITNRDFLREVLAGGYEVESVESAEQALAATQRRLPDVVLADVMLPGIDGIELTRRLRADSATATVPIVLLTGSTDKELTLRGLEAGADDFLNKPLNLVELEVRLHAHRHLIALRREAAVIHGNERYRVIVESARDFAIFTYDEHGSVLSWNPGAEAITGFSAAEIIGQPFDAIYTPQDRDRGVPAMETRRAHRTGRFINERWHQRKDGTLFWGSGIVMPLREDKARPSCMKILRDQTAVHLTQVENARLLKTAQEATREAKIANQTKDRFLATLSHELRTPLTPVTFALHMLARQKDLPDTVREAHDMIGRSVNTELHLIEDLLDISRIAHGKFELRPVPTDLHEVVRQAVELCQEEIADKNLELNVALEAEQRWTMGETTRLQQVFWNLLKNAAKFTPPGGQITVRSSSSYGHTVVEVSDTGIGMTPEVLGRIFEPFEQADAAHAQRYGGLGLGLAISHAVVVAHGGQITVESLGPDQGTTFRVRVSTRVD